MGAGHGAVVESSELEDQQVIRAGNSDRAEKFAEELSYPCAVRCPRLTLWPGESGDDSASALTNGQPRKSSLSNHSPSRSKTSSALFSGLPPRA